MQSFFDNQLLKTAREIKVLYMLNENLEMQKRQEGFVKEKIDAKHFINASKNNKKNISKIIYRFKLRWKEKNLEKEIESLILQKQMEILEVNKKETNKINALMEDVNNLMRMKKMIMQKERVIV